MVIQENAQTMLGFILFVNHFLLAELKSSATSEGINLAVS